MTENSKVWKNVKGFEGFYQVSNEGDVRSLDRLIDGGGTQNKRKLKGVLLKGGVSNSGYVKFTLTNSGKMKYYSGHRLVALNFIPNPNNYEQVNHIDGDKLNNNVNNLEWCDSFYNMKHAEDLGLVNNKGTNSPNNKYSEAQIIEVKKLLQEGYSSVKIARMTGVNRTTVYRVRTKKQWKHL